MRREAKMVVPEPGTLAIDRRVSCTRASEEEHPMPKPWSTKPDPLNTKPYIPNF